MKGRLRQLSSDYVLRLERSYPALNYSMLNDDAVMSIAVGDSSNNNNSNNDSTNPLLVVDGSNNNNNNNNDSSSVMYDENALILSLLPEEALTPFSLYGHTSIGLPIETRGVGIGGGGVGGRGLGMGTGGGFGVRLSKEELEQCYMIITPLSEHTLWTGGLISDLHTLTYLLTHTPYQRTLSHASSHTSSHTSSHPP